MTVPKTHYIHSRNGKIGTGTDSGPTDIDAIFAEIASSGAKRLVIHFHGGLVPKASALEIAKTLMPVYSPGAYPLFFVWESGPWETVRNNIADIARESIFQELVRKLLEYTLQRVGISDDARSISGSAVDPREVKRVVRAFFEDPVSNPVPYSGAFPFARDTTRAAALAIDENAIQMDLEADADFVRAVQSISEVPEATRGAPAVTEVRPQSTQMDATVLNAIAPSGTTRGLFSMAALAIRVAKALVRIVKRFRGSRDHGFHATVVEEVLRGFYGDVIGKTFFWNQMKKDTLDAFGGDPDVHAGTAFLRRLKAAISGGLHLDRIFLVGHSTGGIYISHFLEGVDAEGFEPSVNFDIVLLAPANTHELFANTVANHGTRIRWLRMFGMENQVESADGLLGDDWKRAFYPSSLLYFVSGLLEREADEPLLGMQRPYKMDSVFTEPDYPYSCTVRAWLASTPGRLVWSSADDGDGRRSMAHKHGDFDNDKKTLESLTWIVTH
jgi:hypothetical protein